MIEYYIYVPTLHAKNKEATNYWVLFGGGVVSSHFQ